MHNRSQASLVVCQLRNAEWKKQEKSVIMMIPTLQLKPRLTTVHSLVLIVIRPWKFNHGNPFQQCLNVWRSPLFRHEPVCEFNKSCAYTFSKSASLKTLQCTHPPSLTSEKPHTHSLFASHEITFFCSSLMYKEVTFTLLHFCRKSECELSGHQKPDRQNPSRMLRSGVA